VLARSIAGPVSIPAWPAVSLRRAVIHAGKPAENRPGWWSSTPAKGGGWRCRASSAGRRRV